MPVTPGDLAVRNREAAAIRAGKVLSSQCMFGTALQAERDLALDFWSTQCPDVAGFDFTIADRRW